MNLMDLIHTARPQDALRNRIIEALRRIRDPELPVNIYDLGLIYELEIGVDGWVDLKMTLTAPGCPVAQYFPSQVASAIKAIPGVSEVHIELVWEPPWDATRMSSSARLELGMM